MNCQQAALALQELIDEALPAEAAQALRAHLEACLACRRRFQGLTALARALGGLAAYSLEPQARARILSAWAARRRGQAWRMWTSAGLLALACSGLALAFWLVDSGINGRNGLTVLNALLDPARAEAMLRLRLFNAALVLQQWWSGVSVWLKPFAASLGGGIVLTAFMFGGTAAAFLIISMVTRHRPAPRLGGYL